MILEVDGKMVITTICNQFYPAQVFLFCMMDTYFIGGEGCKQKFPSLLLKAGTLLFQPRWENWFHLWVLFLKTAGLFRLLTRDQYFVTLSGKIMKDVSLLQRSQILLQGQSILTSSIITFDVFSDRTIIMKSIDTTKHIVDIFTKTLG